MHSQLEELDATPAPDSEAYYLSNPSQVISVGTSLGENNLVIPKDKGHSKIHFVIRKGTSRSWQVHCLSRYGLMINDLPLLQNEQMTLVPGDDHDPGCNIIRLPAFTAAFHVVDFTAPPLKDEPRQWTQLPSDAESISEVSTVSCASVYSISRGPSKFLEWMGGRQRHKPAYYLLFPWSMHWSSETYTTTIDSGDDTETDDGTDSDNDTVTAGEDHISLQSDQVHRCLAMNTQSGFCYLSEGENRNLEDLAAMQRFVKIVRLHHWPERAWILSPIEVDASTHSIIYEHRGFKSLDSESISLAQALRALLCTVLTLLAMYDGGFDIRRLRDHKIVIGEGKFDGYFYIRDYIARRSRGREEGTSRFIAPPVTQTRLKKRTSKHIRALMRIIDKASIVDFQATAETGELDPAVCQLRSDISNRRSDFEELREHCKAIFERLDQAIYGFEPIKFTLHLRLRFLDGQTQVINEDASKLLRTVLNISTTPLQPGIRRSCEVAILDFESALQGFTSVRRLRRLCSSAAPSRLIPELSSLDHSTSGKHTTMHIQLLSHSIPVLDSATYLHAPKLFSCLGAEQQQSLRSELHGLETILPEDTILIIGPDAEPGIYVRYSYLGALGASSGQHTAPSPSKLDDLQANLYVLMIFELQLQHCAIVRRSDCAMLWCSSLEHLVHECKSAKATWMDFESAIRFLQQHHLSKGEECLRKFQSSAWEEVIKDHAAVLQVTSHPVEVSDVDVEAYTSEEESEYGFPVKRRSRGNLDTRQVKIAKDGVLKKSAYLSPRMMQNCLPSLSASERDRIGSPSPTDDRSRLIRSLGASSSATTSSIGTGTRNSKSFEFEGHQVALSDDLVARQACLELPESILDEPRRSDQPLGHDLASLYHRIGCEQDTCCDEL